MFFVRTRITKPSRRADASAVLMTREKVFTIHRQSRVDHAIMITGRRKARSQLFCTKYGEPFAEQRDLPVRAGRKIKIAHL